MAGGVNRGEAWDDLLLDHISRTIVETEHEATTWEDDGDEA